MPATTPCLDPELRAAINRLGGYRAFAARFGLNPRTAERIFSGAKPCPPALRAQLLAELERAANG